MDGTPVWIQTSGVASRFAARCSSLFLTMSASDTKSTPSPSPSLRLIPRGSPRSPRPRLAGASTKCGAALRDQVTKESLRPALVILSLSHSHSNNSDLPSSPLPTTDSPPQCRGTLSRSGSGQSIPTYYDTAPHQPPGFGLGIDGPWDRELLVSSFDRTGHAASGARRALAIPPRRASRSSSSSASTNPSPQLRNASSDTTNSVGWSSATSTAPTSTGSPQPSPDETCQTFVGDSSRAPSLSAVGPRPRTAPQRRPPSASEERIQRRQNALFGRSCSVSGPGVVDFSHGATKMDMAPSEGDAAAGFYTASRPSPPSHLLPRPSPPLSCPLGVINTLPTGYFRIAEPSISSTASRPRSSASDAPQHSSFRPTPTSFLTLQLDQEAYRGVTCALDFNPEASAVSHPLLEFRPRDATVAYPFHYSTFQGAPVLRSVHVQDDLERDYLATKAMLRIGRTNGVYKAEGGGGKGDRWSFLYEVQDRTSLNDKPIPGEKLLRPLVFICTPNFLDASKGKTVDVWRVLRKSFTRTSSATLVRATP